MGGLWVYLLPFVFGACPGLLLNGVDNLMVDPVYMRTLGNGPKKVNGRFKFEDVIDVQIMGNFRDKRVIHLKRQNIDTSSHHVVGESAVYGDEEVILRQDCLDVGFSSQCIEYAIVTENGTSTYVNTKGKLLSLPVNSGVFGVADPELAQDAQETEREDGYTEKEEDDTANEKDQTEETAEQNRNHVMDNKTGWLDGYISKLHRERREVFTDNFNETRAIKLLMVVDKAAMERFLPLNDNDIEATKEDIEKFLTLVCNSAGDMVSHTSSAKNISIDEVTESRVICLADEMTMHYQSLKAYKIPMTVNGTKTSMDIAISLAGVKFPPNNTDETVSNFDWSESNRRDGGEIYVYTDEVTSSSGKRKHVFTGLLSDFGKFIKPLNFDLEFDHAMLITGYNLMEQRLVNGTETMVIDLKGMAWMNTMCRFLYRSFSRHTSVVEMGGIIARAASHELGHAVGMKHDDSDNPDVPGDCPSMEYIMSSSEYVAMESNVETYNKFSECSARYVHKFTSQIPVLGFMDTCLRPVGATFKADLCLGFLGTQFTFDDQCSFTFGTNSTRSPDPNQEKENHLQAGYVQSCIVLESDFLYPFLCTDPSVPEMTYVVTEAAQGTKCIAPDGKRDPSNICYNGKCVPKGNLCT